MDFRDNELNGSEPSEVKLDALFAEYRSAIPDREAGANFMPSLWQKIEAKRGEKKASALDLLFSDYRRAIPDPDPSANFMPTLWQKIEARRRENVSVFRRLTQACLLATAALTLVMAVVIPRLQSEQVYNVGYVDVLDAAHSVDSAQLLSGDYQ